MYNLLISLGAFVLAFVATYFGAGLNWLASLFPALVVGLGAYFLLARRSLKQLEAIMTSAQADLSQAGAAGGRGLDNARVETGIAKIKSGFALAKWQFLVAPQVHAQLGMILYLLKRFDEARPHLEQSFVRIGQARAMLGALYFKDKKYDQMTQVFENAVSHNKKDGFLWSIYAWCLDRAGLREKALDALSRGVAESPSDERLKANQLALQNNKPLQMRSYGQEWWAFHLEPVPMDVAAQIDPRLAGAQGRPGYRNFRPPRPGRPQR